MNVRIENRKRSISLVIRFRRPKICYLQAEQKLEASTEATQNLSSLLQGVLDLQNLLGREIGLALRLQRQMAIVKPQSSAQLHILQQDALQLLRVNDHAVVQDLHSMLRQSRSIDDRLQSQA